VWLIQPPGAVLKQQQNIYLENSFIEIFSCYLRRTEKIHIKIFSVACQNMKEEILQTALKQFLKYGIREMSIQKLVEPMGISTKTVYKYFKNKEELLEETLQLHYAQQFQLLEERTADQKVVPLILDIWYMAFEREYKVTNTFFQDLNYYYPELEKKIQVAISSKFTKQFAHIIRKGMDEGVLMEKINPEVVMEGIYVLYAGVIRTERFKPLRASPLDVLLNTIVVFIRGFCTARGIQELEEHIQTFQPFGKGKKVKEKFTSQA
jgi:AcrR family transcriptional regulator